MVQRLTGKPWGVMVKLLVARVCGIGFDFGAQEIKLCNHQTVIQVFYKAVH